MPERTRIKMCGITRVEDALEAARLGVDALGFIFYAGSPRHVTAERAASSRLRFARHHNRWRRVGRTRQHLPGALRIPN